MFSLFRPVKPSVLFETNLALRRYTLNRRDKLNALDESMITLLRNQVEVSHFQGTTHFCPPNFALRNGVSLHLPGRLLEQG
jgi:hypothetical protein